MFKAVMDEYIRANHLEKVEQFTRDLWDFNFFDVFEEDGLFLQQNMNEEDTEHEIGRQRTRKPQR